MTHPIFDKTEKGREEIATRKYQLPSRLRTLLLLLDGKHAVDDVLEKVAGLGLAADSINELLNNGFIRPVFAPVEPSPSALADAVEQPLPSAPMLEGQNQFEAIYHFYTETIKSTIGLRGYPLQLKVERASTIEEFRMLRQPYLEAVLKAKGTEVAKGIRMRLDEVLYAGETIPPLDIAGL